MLRLLGAFLCVGACVALIPKPNTPPINIATTNPAVQGVSSPVNEFYRETAINSRTFGASVESAPALVLNADFTPLSFMPLSLFSWQDSLRAIFAGRAVAVSHYPSLVVRSVQETFEVPSVIALKHYHKTPTDRVPALSRRNVYLRYSFRCQYCLATPGIEKLSLDHVIPRAKGGRLTWTNTVTACCDCNFRKGTHLVEDLPKLGMRLRASPREPSRAELQAKSKICRNRKPVYPEEWSAYL
jgi:hypothetical protein